MVFVSSIGVNGPVSASGVFRFDDAPAPVGNYARSKAEAEESLRVRAEQLDVELVILRPPTVYGPGVRGTFGSLVRAVRSRWPLPVRGIDNHRDLIGVRNLADAILAVALADGVAGEVFLVCDRQPVSLESLVRAIASAYRVRPRLVPLPSAVLSLAVCVCPQSRTLQRLFGDLRIDDGRLTELVGWRPAFSVLQELEEMAAREMGAAARGE